MHSKTMNPIIRNLHVSVIQYDIIWCNATDNISKLEKLISCDVDVDLIVLPEMWATGFVVKPDTSLVPQVQLALDWMFRKAKEMDSAICGSLPFYDDTTSKFYNRFFFVCPDGSCFHYDKKHLFGYGGEKDCYLSGSERKVITWRGVRFLPQVCYDLRFPVWSRNYKDYDVAIYVASWPDTRSLAWSTLLQSRAIENQAYVIGCNRVGCDLYCKYDGRSAVVSPYGSVIADLPLRSDGCICTVLELEKLFSFRKKFPVLEDSDSLSDFSL